MVVLALHWLNISIHGRAMLGICKYFHIGIYVLPVFVMWTQDRSKLLLHYTRVLFPNIPFSVGNLDLLENWEIKKKYIFAFMYICFNLLSEKFCAYFLHAKILSYFLSMYTVKEET